MEVSMLQEEGRTGAEKEGKKKLKKNYVEKTGLI